MNITMQQVINKRNEAERRALLYIKHAMDAKTEQEYELNVDLAVRAANDAQTWTMVLNALENAPKKP